jgi:hypothetical protein
MVLVFSLIIMEHFSRIIILHFSSIFNVLLGVISCDFMILHVQDEKKEGLCGWMCAQKKEIKIVEYFGRGYCLCHYLC